MGAQNRRKVSRRDHTLGGEIRELLVLGLLKESTAQGRCRRTPQQGGQRGPERLLPPLFTSPVEVVEVAGRRAQRLDHRGQRLIRQLFSFSELLPHRVRPGIDHVAASQGMLTCRDQTVTNFRV
ncbi:hypothetical protein [Streptomyces aculeolatus]|uniref:hypothetical protein n=1 Tax=Streptomyces aculeolatus TaxID=270689 RepID=UPI001CED3A41|nr:hypothetical protein [Streptomyces aculeolatus]